MTPYDKSKNPRAAYITDLNEDGDGSEFNFDEDILPEEVAVEVHEAFMALRRRRHDYGRSRGIAALTWRRPRGPAATRHRKNAYDWLSRDRFALDVSDGVTGIEMLSAPESGGG